MNKPQIAVSVLSSDFGHLAQEIASLNISGADLYHLDIMDGHFVPNLSFGNPLVKAIAPLAMLPLDAHLMVTNPGAFVESFSQMGVKYFSFHQETVYHPHRLIQEIKAAGMKAGIALNPATPLSTLDEILPDADFILIMSVNPGFSGQAFISNMLRKVEHLKESITAQTLSTLIQVDGGVTADNARALIDAGADILVSASYVFGSGDYARAISNLKNA